jgi:hypothetical protein
MSTAKPSKKIKDDLEVTDAEVSVYGQEKNYGTLSVTIKD